MDVTPEITPSPSRALLLVCLAVLSSAGCVAASSSAGYGRTGRQPNLGPAEARNEYAPVVAALVPGYSLHIPAGESPTADEPEHGFVWTWPILIRAGDWRHGAAISYAQYLRSSRRAGRLVYRLRLFSVPAEDAILHLYFGAGGFYDNLDGAGPRGELGWLLGRLGRGGGMLGGAYQYEPRHDTHSAELTLTFFIPYVID